MSSYSRGALVALFLTVSLSLSLHAQVPGLINTQGRVVMNGTNFTGTGTFQFALVDGGGVATFWSNGAAAVSAPVSKGLYSVLLGDTNLANMAALPPELFTNSDVRLRVWFNGQLLTPDQRITAAAYAMNAKSAQAVAAGAITTSMIASGAVGSGQIAAGAVTVNALAANAVTTSAIADGAVSMTKIAQNLDVSLQAGILNPTPEMNDYFGVSVAGVGTNRLVIGANDDNTGAAGAGSAYVYDLNGVLLATITNPTPSASEHFGGSVAGVGTNRLVISAAWDNTGAIRAGSAYVYDLNGVLLATITNPSPAVGDSFGKSVAGVGTNRIVIGAPWDDAGATDAGSAYVYDLNGVLLATITNPSPAVSDQFGYSMAGVGTNRVVIGAPWDDAGAMNAGSAYIYDLNGVLLATITNPAPVVGDQFGYSMAGVGTNRVVIGAPWDDAGATDAGSAYVYDLNGVLLATITNPSPVVGDYFGYSVAGVGTSRIVIGADGANGSFGEAYVYDLNGTLLATITNPSPSGSDAFGCAVAGIGDDHIVSGARAANIGAAQAGGSYVYYLPGTTHAVLAGDGAGLTGLNAGALVSGTVADARLSANMQALAGQDGGALTNVTASYVTGAVGAGLTDSNTFFISSSAPAGGDGSMARPWNTLYALTNNAGGRLNGKTVILLAGLYLTSGDIIFDATCSNLTVKGWDQQNVRIVSTNNNYRIFTLNIGANNIVLDGMTMTSTNAGNGGAVYLQPGCTVQNCTFLRSAATGSTIYNGGGVYCSLGGMVQNCTFSGNWAEHHGGAVYLSTNGTIQNCTFSGNQAGNSGGGVECFNGGTVLNSVFTGNAATNGYGGAVNINIGGTVVNCQFFTNSAMWGGSVDCFVVGLVQGCLINGSTALNGGGVYCQFGGQVQNCSVNGNTATAGGSGGGGGYCNQGGTMQGCQFSGNTAPAGGGVYIETSGTVQNCMFSGNTVSGSGGGMYCYNGGTVQNCSIIRGGGSTNSVATVGSATWMSVWTNMTGAASLVTWSTFLWN